MPDTDNITRRRVLVPDVIWAASGVSRQIHEAAI